MINGKINSLGQSLGPLKSSQRGVTLIDAMIALVIFSIGMLAIAALQTVSIQSNFEGIQRSHAVSLAYDLLERMRMNPTALATYVPGASVEYSYSDTLTVPNPDCSTNACTSAQQVAAMDLYEFQLMLRGANEVANAKSVGGIVNPTVCITGPTNGQYTLTIAWKGQTSLPLATAPANTCGDNLYDKVPIDNDYAYRRIMIINTYI